MEVSGGIDRKSYTDIPTDPEDLEDNDGAERDSWAVVDETEEGQPILPQMPAGARNEAMVKVFREYGNAIAGAQYQRLDFQPTIG